MRPESVSAWDKASISDTRLLARCAILALLIEFSVLTFLGWDNHWLSHPQKTKGLDESKFIQAEMYQMPEKAELTELKPEKVVKTHEASISKEVDKGRIAKPNEKAIQEDNQVSKGEQAPLAPTHGPVAVFTPAPVIPGYLQSKDIHSSVVIEFLVSSQGTVTPRLLASSGDEELDAVALGTAKKWQFRPAEQDHKPLDAKVRLRIVFEVH